jgi:hypothetical protein
VEINFVHSFCEFFIQSWHVHGCIIDSRTRVQKSLLKNPHMQKMYRMQTTLFDDDEFLPAGQKCSIVPNAKTNCHLCKISKAEFGLLPVRLSFILSVK